MDKNLKHAKVSKPKIDLYKFHYFKSEFKSEKSEIIYFELKLEK